MNAPKGKLIIKVDVEQKNGYTFSNGLTIRLERDVQNLDRKYSSQVLGEVISSEYVPHGSLVLFHHNAIHDVNVIFDSDYLTESEREAGFKIISINESQCFLWKNPGAENWNQMKNFCTALRVFKPYGGVMLGIEPKIIKNVLYLTSGEYQDKVAHTLKAADYQLTFRNENGIDQHIIRCRHFEGEDNEREELVAIDGWMTELVEKGELLVGITSNDAKIKQQWLQQKQF